MPIGFVCQHCGQKLTVADSRAGQRGNCPKCRGVVVVPGAAQAAKPASSPTVSTPASPPGPSPPLVETPRKIESPSHGETPVQAESPSKIEPPAKVETPTKVATTVKSEPPAPVSSSASTASVAPGAIVPPAPAGTTPQPGPPAPPPPAPSVSPPRSPDAPPPVPAGAALTAPPVAAEESPRAAPAATNELPEWIAQSERQESPWIYEDSSTPASSAPVPPGQVDLSRVSVPRFVLFSQGIALGLVALVAFALGVLAGGGERGSGSANASGSDAPRVFSGKVEHVTSGGTKFPDEGAVVLLLPQQERPATEERPAALGLRPEDPLPPASAPNLQLLKLMGASYARTDVAGQFRVTLPRGGKYFLLVVSHHAARRQGKDVNRADLAALGRYVNSPADLLGDRRYRWRAEEIVRDAEVSIVLD